MLDQDTALALLTIADEAGATVALVGDRSQLPTVGRGGVLDMAANAVPQTFDLASVHRFADPEYAQVTLDLRSGRDPDTVFDGLRAFGLVRLHATEDAMLEAVARTACAP
jgi:hypothetical protein